MATRIDMYSNTHKFRLWVDDDLQTNDVVSVWLDNGDLVAETADGNIIAWSKGRWAEFHTDEGDLRSPDEVGV